MNFPCGVQRAPVFRISRAHARPGFLFTRMALAKKDQKKGAQGQRDPLVYMLKDRILGRRVMRFDKGMNEREKNRSERAT